MVSFFSGISWPHDLNVFLKILNVSGQKKWILNELFSLFLPPPSSGCLSSLNCHEMVRLSLRELLLSVNWFELNDLKKFQSSFLCGVTGFYTFRKTRKITNVTFLNINHLIYDNRGENFGCVGFVSIKLTQYSPAYQLTLQHTYK